MIRRLTLIGWLTALWMALWREASTANLLSGVAVAVGVAAVVGQRGFDEPQHRLRPVAVARLLGYFGWKLLEANVVLAREVLTRRDTTRPGIIAVPLHPGSDLVTTIVANAVSLTPGTLTLDVRPDPLTLFIHVLHLHDEARVRGDVRRLEALVRDAHGYETPPDAPTQRTASGPDHREHT